MKGRWEDRNIQVRDTSPGCLPNTLPPGGDEPATNMHALDGNRTRDLSPCSTQADALYSEQAGEGRQFPFIKHPDLLRRLKIIMQLNSRADGMLLRESFLLPFLRSRYIF